MSRITDTEPQATGLLTRLLLKLSARKVRQLTGRRADGMIGPAEAYARIPRLLIGYGAFEEATARVRGVPDRLKKLAELKAATMTSCEYCIDIGSHIARRAGLSDAELLGLSSYRQSDCFDELDRLVLDYAVGMSRTPVEVPDELFAQLRRHFDGKQIVELTNLIALENMRGRFNLALGFGAAGFSEGMVCAVPEPASRADSPTNGATAQIAAV
jgi:AhpD family alkylhydroperoxidase